MDDYLTKPVRVAELARCLERWGRLSAVPVPSPSLPAQGGAPGEGADEAPALLDLAVLAELRELEEGGEVGMVQSFIDGFAYAVPQHLVLLREAAAAGSPEQLRQHAHRLKGTAANVGARGVAERCDALERLGRSGSVHGSEPLIDEVGRVFHQTMSLFAEQGGPRP
jgi:HPt (histidine-containing phosphotransfer) domain-containing protein